MYMSRTKLLWYYFFPVAAHRHDPIKGKTVPTLNRPRPIQIILHSGLRKQDLCICVQYDFYCFLQIRHCKCQQKLYSPGAMHGHLSSGFKK
jgi:hypothetical protein